MTEHPRNLAAWLDDELGADESSAVTRHVELCGECQARARSYGQVSGMLSELELERKTSRRWRAAVVWAGAIAAAVLLAVALWPSKSAGPLVARDEPVTPKTTVHVESIDVVPTRTTVKRVHRRKQVVQAPVQPAMYTDGPVVRVAIPAEALFAPGAMPAGAEIYADLVLAADGSARELRLLP